MRPRSDARAALLASALALTPHAGAVTWRDVGAHAGLAPAVAKRTFENMVRAGELMPVGERKVEGAIRPMRTCRPASMPRSAELTSVMRTWPTIQ